MKFKTAIGQGSCSWGSKFRNTFPPATVALAPFQPLQPAQAGYSGTVPLPRKNLETERTGADSLRLFYSTHWAGNNNLCGEITKKRQKWQVCLVCLFNDNISDCCLYSATVKRQHFNCLGQVLRQNCRRLLQTFQIFVSSATPTLELLDTRNTTWSSMRIGIWLRSRNRIFVPH